MNIFDNYIREVCSICEKETIQSLRLTSSWPLQEKNSFLMERDTYLELGGYPKESINLIIPTSELSGLTELTDGIYCIGDPGCLRSDEKHVSFGKIVLLETEVLNEDNLYAFTQEVLLTDSRIRMKDVMLRQSPTHYNINLRISRNAYKNGFDAQKLASTIYQSFKDMKQVKKVVVLLLFGESLIYHPLFTIAEKIKEVTLTLNHIFDGIDMDCSHCDVSEICSEIEGMREYHRRKINKQRN